MSTVRWYGRWDAVFASGVPAKWQRGLWAWLVRQRWFLDKEMERVKLVLRQSQCIRVADRVVWQLLLGVGTRTYQVALVLLDEVEGHHAGRDSEGASPSHPHDAVIRLEGHESGLVVDAWQWPPLAQWAWQQLMPGHFCPEVMVEAGASNSQIRFGDVAVLKVQRVITPGIHPEEEMGELLSRRGATMTVPLLARLCEGCTTMGLLFAYQAGANDGWAWFLEQAESPKALAAIEQLGQRTRELHDLLGQPSDEEAFAPDSLTSEIWMNRQQLVAERLQRVMGLLKRHRPVDLRTAEQVRRFLRQPPVVIMQSEMPDAKLQRIHGDYHLGQVLRTADDWKIIDFEGEPLRPLAERRAKDLPLRDVAGMLRSFHYGLATRGCEDASLHQLLRQAFLRGYGVEETPILGLLELEKALYEIEYEVRTRPGWLWIPMGAGMMRPS